MRRTIVRPYGILSHVETHKYASQILKQLMDSQRDAQLCVSTEMMCFVETHNYASLILKQLMDSRRDAQLCVRTKFCLTHNETHNYASLLAAAE